MFRAKFYVSRVTQFASPGAPSAQVNVEFQAVSADEIPENQRFHAYTPAGKTEMTVTNPEVVAQLQPGQVWYVDFTEAAS